MQQFRSIPLSYLILLTALIFWFTTIFFGFGLFAPSNATVIVIMILCALSVTFAIFLILELNWPFEGLIRIPSDPLRDAISHLSRWSLER
ncbi:MAG TPA: hypothetical protein VHT73_16360 [Thermodesulfobacteriota bacterium]|nr:hypothetical protein [Thermodesulfobacteriota bacterium]